MSLQATARGVTDHELAYMVETTYQRLSRVGITGPLANRIMLRMVLGACDWPEAEAMAAIERLFPATIEKTKGGTDGERD